MRAFSSIAVIFLVFVASGTAWGDLFGFKPYAEEFYERLGLVEGASSDQVKERLDLFLEKFGSIEKRYRTSIQEAITILGDSEQKARYDDELARKRGSMPGFQSARETLEIQDFEDGPYQHWEKFTQKWRVAEPHSIERRRLEFAIVSLLRPEWRSTYEVNERDKSDRQDNEFTEEMEAKFLSDFERAFEAETPQDLRSAVEGLWKNYYGRRSKAHRHWALEITEGLFSERAKEAHSPSDQSDLVLQLINVPRDMVGDHELRFDLVYDVISKIPDGTLKSKFKTLANMLPDIPGLKATFVDLVAASAFASDPMWYGTELKAIAQKMERRYPDIRLLHQFALQESPDGMLSIAESLKSELSQIRSRQEKLDLEQKKHADRVRQNRKRLKRIKNIAFTALGVFAGIGAAQFGDFSVLGSSLIGLLSGGIPLLATKGAKPDNLISLPSSIVEEKKGLVDTKNRLLLLHQAVEKAARDCATRLGNL